MNPLLRSPRKTLAAALGCNVGYVSALFRAGLPRDADAARARAWLDAHPGFRKRTAYPSREHKGTPGNT